MIVNEIMKVEGFVDSDVCNFLFKGVVVDSGNTIVPVGTNRLCQHLRVIFHMRKPLVECLTHLRSWSPTPILNPSDFGSGVGEGQSS